MISQHSAISDKKADNLFQLIHDAAIANNFDTLKKLIHIGICFSDVKNQNGQPIIEALAENGHSEAVLLLVNHFFVSKENALKGAMQGKLQWQEKHSVLIEQLNLLISEKNKAKLLSLKMQIIEVGKKKDQCSSLIANLQSMQNSRASRSFSSLHFNSDKDYINKNVDLKKSINDICSGTYNHFSQDIQREIVANILNNDHKLLTYIFSNTNKIQHSEFFNNLFNNEETLLRFISLIKDEKSRHSLVEEAHKRNTAIEIQPLCLKANKIIHLMHEEDLTYEQARAWKLSLHIWFLQGKQLVTQRGMPLDVFIELSTYIVNMSFKNTKQLYDKHYEKMSLKLKNTTRDMPQKSLTTTKPLWKMSSLIFAHTNTEKADSNRKEKMETPLHRVI